MLPLFEKGKDPLLLPPNIFRDWRLKIGICLKFVVFKMDSFLNPAYSLHVTVYDGVGWNF